MEMEMGLLFLPAMHKNFLPNTKFLAMVDKAIVHTRGQELVRSSTQFIRSENKHAMFVSKGVAVEGP
jgi:hypothetical protein